MNEDPVEALLAKLKPAALGNELMARLTAARPQPASSARRTWGFLGRWLVPVGAVACAALVTVKVLDLTSKPPRPPLVAASKTMPVIVQDHTLKAREMGVMIGPNRQPYQMMEYQWVESETIVPGQNAPAFRLETTRREIVPVQLEVY